MVQYIKDLLVLDVYRHQCQVQGRRLTAEVMDGAKRNVQRTKDILLKHYGGDVLNQYPSRLEKDPNVKIKEDDKKKRKEKTKPTKEQRGPRPAP